MILGSIFFQGNWGPVVWVRILFRMFFSYGAVEIQDPDTGVKLKINGQRLKKFLELPSLEDMECLILRELSCEHWLFFWWISGVTSTRPSLIDPSFSFLSFLYFLFLYIFDIMFLFLFCIYVFLSVIFLDKILLVLFEFYFLFVYFHTNENIVWFRCRGGELKIRAIYSIFNPKKWKKEKKNFCFVLENTCAILIDCILM